MLAEAVLPQPPPADLGGFTVSRGGGSTFYLWQPLAPRHLVAHAPGGDHAEAIGARYRIRWLQGDEERVVERPLDGPRLTDAEREWGEERIRAMAERFDLGRRDVPFGVPDAKPPLRDLWFDTAGRLWAELHTSAGEPRLADIWSREGDLVARLQWPRHIALGPPAAPPRPDHALGIATDSSGVQRVVLLRTGPAPPGS